MIDHITYQVPKGKIGWQGITDFFEALEFIEVEPDEAIEKDWTVRWFAPADYSPGCAIIHLVEPKQVAMSDNSEGEVNLQLGHFCCMVSPLRYEELKDGDVPGADLEAATPGSSRIWVKGPFGLRAEVRSEESVRGGVDPRSIPTEIASTMPVRIQGKILAEALDTYEERNAVYKDNWKRMGLKGMVVRVRERSERAFDAVFKDERALGKLKEDYAGIRDDMIDMINFACFVVRAIEEDNLNGDWF